MKKNRIFSLLAAGIAFTFTACSNSGDNNTTNDSTKNTSTTSTTSTNNYAARADTFRTNVQKGYYLNPRTGKAYTNLKLDTTTGAVTDETGKAVKRYVDTRNWWVYDTNTWDTIGSAQMKNGNLMYRGTNGDWTTYDKRWTDDMGDSTMNNSNNSTMNNNNMNNGTDTGMNNSGHSKMKVRDNGKKIKIKDKQQ